MNELSLFTGAGGGLLGTKLLGFRAIGYVEWEPYCQAVLAQRIADGFLEEAPIFGDIREFVKSGAAREYRGFADVVTAGFPCQPFSVAGKQAAADDPRNMWPATADVLCEVRPRYALLENVPGLLATGYCERIFGDLAALGFDARWGVFSAAGSGAPHIRERLFILADARCQPAQLERIARDMGGAPSGNERAREERQWLRHPVNDGREDVADPERNGLQGKRNGGGALMARRNHSRGVRLPEEVMRQMVPTPTASNTKAVHLRTGGRPARSYLPTPNCPRPHDSQNTAGKFMPGQGQQDLTAAVAKAGGQLNPDWVEWLMGWPIGWSDLRPMATDKFRQWSLAHGENSMRAESATAAKLTTKPSTNAGDGQAETNSSTGQP